MKFTQEEYFPAVHKGPTRVGKVTDLVLLQAEPEGRTTDCEFFWHVGCNGLPDGEARVDDEKVARKFRAFKADVKRIGSHGEVVAWTENDVD